jgi:hypothetical protein
VRICGRTTSGAHARARAAAPTTTTAHRADGDGACGRRRRAWELIVGRAPHLPPLIASARFPREQHNARDPPTNPLSPRFAAAAPPTTHKKTTQQRSCRPAR